MVGMRFDAERAYARSFYRWLAGVVIVCNVLPIAVVVLT